MRRRRRGAPMLLACPRLASDWELAALRALMKPKLENRLAGRAGDQVWPAEGDALVVEVIDLIRDRLGFAPEIKLHAEGDYHLVAVIDGSRLEECKALALLLSRRLPGLWFRFGALHVRGGRFYRRKFGYKLQLTPARDVHLRREIRARLKELL